MNDFTLRMCIIYSHLQWNSIHKPSDDNECKFQNFMHDFKLFDLLDRVAMFNLLFVSFVVCSRCCVHKKWAGALFGESSAVVYVCTYAYLI